MGLAQESRSVYNQQAGGTGIRVTKYPVDAVGVTLTADGAGVGAWKFKAAGANVVNIVAGGVITNGTPFRLVWVSLDTPLHVAVYVVRLGVGVAAAAMAPVLGEYVFNMLVAGPGVGQTIRYCATETAAAALAILGDLAVSTAVNETANCNIGVMTGIGL